MKVFLLTAVVVFLCVFGLCFNIIFRKDGEFPKYDVGSNEEMKKMGIECFKETDARLHARKCPGNYSDACKDCSLFSSES